MTDTRQFTVGDVVRRRHATDTGSGVIQGVADGVAHVYWLADGEPTFNMQTGEWKPPPSTEDPATLEFDPEAALVFHEMRLRGR